MGEIKTVLVVGAGTMGHGFAQIFAMKHFPVWLADENEDLLKRARGWIMDNLNYMVELGEIGKERVQLTLSHIQFTTDLKQAASKADYVLEAVNENLDLKKRLFQQLGNWTQPHVVLATNTSSFDINELSVVTAHPERVIGTHWFHPPQITPCVEVIPSNATSQETVGIATDLMKRIGKVPTRCKSAPGFVANRIQMAMAAEALAIVEAGLATPEEVDQIVRTSFGFRLSAYGPFQICDQAGADTYYSIYEYLYGKLKREQMKPSPFLKKQVEQGRLGLKTSRGFYEYKEGAADTMKRERDRKLYARLRLFREEQKNEKKS
jgi:3-hydroxybutyryl-CoA dehydrogenase